MTKRILITLGAPNSPNGVLSHIAKSRLDFCLKIFKENDVVLCTGGWGQHFNVADKPHAFYAKEYLTKNGILPNFFLDFALSCNTVEDAVKVKEIVSNYTNPHLIVITSDFHVKRAQLIFNTILNGYNIKFHGVSVELPEEQRKKIEAHEKSSIKGILKYGLKY